MLTFLLNKFFIPLDSILYIGFDSKGDLIPNKLVKNLLESFSLINLDFLLLQTVHLDESIILPFKIFLNFDFLLSVFLLHFKK